MFDHNRSRYGLARRVKDPTRPGRLSLNWRVTKPARAINPHKKIDETVAQVANAIKIND